MVAVSLVRNANVAAVTSGENPLTNSFYFVLHDRIQDLCIIFAIIVVFLVFFNTYIFQAGLVSLLIRKFKTTIIISILYLALSVGLHVWTMVSILLIR